MATESAADLPQQKPKWLQLLDEGLDGVAGDDEAVSQDLVLILTSMVRELLLSDDSNAPATFARRFDDLYGTVYEPKFNGYRRTKKGWTGYLLIFYDILLGAATVARYDDPTQDKLIQLLVELGKLPPHAVKVFVVSVCAQTSQSQNVMVADCPAISARRI